MLNGQLYKWRHPMSPAMLMGKALFLADALLAHLRALSSISDDSSSKLRGPVLGMMPQLMTTGTGVAPRILYDADNDESLGGSLLERAFKPMTVEQYVAAHSPHQLFMLNSSIGSSGGESWLFDEDQMMA